MEREILRFASQEELEKSFPSDNPNDYMLWEEAGRPYLLVPVETYKNFTVYLDRAFGNLFLYEGDKPIAKGRYEITEHDYFEKNHPDIVVLDKENFGVSKYIWR